MAIGAFIGGEKLEKKFARGDEPSLLSGYAPGKAKQLRELALDPDALAARGLRYERLDQLLIEHLLGVRG